MKLWDKISSLIATEKEAKGQGQAQPSAEAGANSDRIDADRANPLTPADANGVLAMLPKGQALDQFSAGQIQLLNIDSVRTDLGSRWNKLEHQVRGVVESTLKHILTESDIFTQISDHEYLVIFPNLTEQKA